MSSPSCFRDASVLVTGADGALGGRFVEAVLARGARDVLAWGLRPDPLQAVAAGDPRVTQAVVDITDAEAVHAALAHHPRLTLVLHAAGVELKRQVTDPAVVRNAHLETTVNFLGTVHVAQAALPLLRQHPSAFVPILSIAALAPILPLGIYGAAKAAAHHYVLCLREELAGSPVAVLGVYPGWIGAGMGDGVAVAKADPGQVIQAILDGVEAGQPWIFPDAMSADLAARHPAWTSPHLLRGLAS